MHVDIDRFAHLHSPLHNWDQRYKIAGLFSLILVISMLSSLWALCCSVLIVAVLMLISKIPVTQIVRPVLFPLLFLIPLFIFLPLTAGGEKYIVYGIPIYNDGILLSVRIAVKALCIIMLFLLITGTSPFTVSMKALRSLKLPAKIVDLIMFTYRYIYIYLDDLRALRQSIMMKGYRSKTSRHSFKTSSYLVGSLLVRSFEQTDRMFNAMTCRGYTGEVKVLAEFKSTWKDVAKFIIAMCIAIMLAGWELFMNTGELL
ncbi:MAG TPA: cobalt ECF transporter T component CbiQ [Spirochaetota bacterium]|nr:cobalt ECF transporter T component CbiQ [Spirochaetota bacterium]